MNSLRDLPSVDHLLQRPQAAHWMDRYGRPLVVEAIRTALAEARTAFLQNDALPAEETLLQRSEKLLEAWTTPSILPVINASGVVLHTNLGRAPLSLAAIQAIQAVSSGYSNLEYDLDKGQRGSRLVHSEVLLQRLTGCEAALVVNNNASAVMLVLAALARRKGVLIARTQLVEIGGGFRVPEVMQQSGARLVEVGATNRVHLVDYETALETGGVALLMHVHRSNFRIVGFTSEPSLAELAEVAHRQGLPLVDDLGSGALLDTSRFGLDHEPTVQESLQAGADLVCFSGDKLLGGPQAGIIVGKAELVTRLRKHPLARALRADKLCLAALSATLMHYLKAEAEACIPIWQMIGASLPELELRANNLAHALSHGTVQASRSAIGGGSLPEETLPTFVLALSVHSPNRFLARLRQSQPPVIARLEDDQVRLDVRTVLPEQEETLLQVLRNQLEKE